MTDLNLTSANSIFAVNSNVIDIDTLPPGRPTLISLYHQFYASDDSSSDEDEDGQTYDIAIRDSFNCAMESVTLLFSDLNVPVKLIRLVTKLHAGPRNWANIVDLYDISSYLEYVHDTVVRRIDRSPPTMSSVKRNRIIHALNGNTSPLTFQESAVMAKLMAKQAEYAYYSHVNNQIYPNSNTNNNYTNTPSYPALKTDCARCLEVRQMMVLTSDPLELTALAITYINHQNEHRPQNLKVKKTPMPLHLVRYGIEPNPGPAVLSILAEILLDTLSTDLLLRHCLLAIALISIKYAVLGQPTTMLAQSGSASVNCVLTSTNTLLLTAPNNPYCKIAYSISHSLSQATATQSIYECSITAKSVDLSLSATLLSTILQTNLIDHAQATNSITYEGPCTSEPIYLACSASSSSAFANNYCIATYTYWIYSTETSLPVTVANVVGVNVVAASATVPVTVTNGVLNRSYS